MAVDKRPARPGGPIYYTYTDVGGGPLFRVVRSPGKRFHQERWDLARSRYVKGLGTDTIRVLYNLPGVFEQVIKGGTVWVVEGEADADALIELGICATTNPGGAGKWRSEYAESLRGAGRIVICYDLDKEDPQTGKRQGEAHALQVEDSVKAVTNRIDFYHAAEGKDVRDHLAAGLGVGDLVKERPGNQNAPEPKPEPREDHGGKATRVKEPAVYQLALERLREHARVNGLPKPRKTDKGWEACCPAHDDKDPSLGISVGTEQPMVVNCQANCEPEAIADALGIDFVDFFDEGTPEYDAALEKELQRQRVQQEARVIISSEAAPDITLPDSSPVDYFNKEAEAIAFSIVDWHVEGGNTLLVAQYKTGKTSLAINLYRSLVNHEPFLGAYTVKEQQGRIAYFDYEMLEDQFRFWLKAGGDMNLNKMVTPYHLRGQVLPLWDKRTRAKVVEWLKRNDTSAIIIDTAARAWAGLVDNENSNTDMLRFTDSLDQLKYEAGITDLFLLTHMGRQAVFMEQGQERARGATRLEDWMDGGWYMTKDTDNVRYLRAQGRGIDIEPITLQYSTQTHKLTTQKVGKVEHQERTADEMIVDILASLSHIPTTSQLAELLGGRKEDRVSKIHGAQRRGLVVGRESGRSIMIELTDVGRELQSRHRNLSQKKKLEADEQDEVDVIKAQVAATAERTRYANKEKRTPRRQGKPKEIDNGTEVTDTDS
jgi:hypothetical protein